MGFSFFGGTGCVVARNTGSCVLSVYYNQNTAWHRRKTLNYLSSVILRLPDFMSVALLVQTAHDLP